jgi:biopolymer transport protein ExbB
MFEIITKGGPLMWFILAASFLAVALFLERLLHLHRAQIDSRLFLDGIYNNLKRNNYLEAISICDDTPGPVASIIQAAILHRDDGDASIRQAMEEAGQTELPRLEANLSWLATLAKITPLLGLTGTVLGMLQTLNTVYREAPLVHSGDLSVGLYQALISTAAGLIVAIPIYGAYNFLVSRVESITADMDASAWDILLFINKKKTLVQSEKQ